VRGTRIPVAILLASIAEMPMDELLREYPQLAREDLQAAILYAAQAVPSPDYLPRRREEREEEIAEPRVALDLRRYVPAQFAQITKCNS
jgi:hypothetical protein